jgi:ABC-2 type transport system permease protein
MKKNWLVNVVGPLTIISFVTLIAMSWTSMQELLIERVGQMDNPVMIAILGDMSAITGGGNIWQAVIAIYAIGTTNIVILFVGFFIPSRLLGEEIDKNSLDMVLSYPIPRWQYLLEKHAVYLVYSILYPISLITFITGSSIIANEEFDINLLVNYGLGVFFTLFALGSISLLCTSIFLESSKSMAASGALIGVQYLLENLGGIVPMLKDIQFLSIFHYLKIGSIIANDMILPLNELLIVILVGIFSLVSALIIFDRREFAVQ